MKPLKLLEERVGNGKMREKAKTQNDEIYTRPSLAWAVCRLGWSWQSWLESVWSLESVEETEAREERGVTQINDHLLREPSSAK